jgi:hypothetical protein
LLSDARASDGGFQGALGRSENICGSGYLASYRCRLVSWEVFEAIKGHWQTFAVQYVSFTPKADIGLA